MVIFIMGVAQTKALVLDLTPPAAFKLREARLWNPGEAGELLWGHAELLPALAHPPLPGVRQQYPYVFGTRCP